MGEMGERETSGETGIDRLVEWLSRGIARRSSRRSFLARLAAAVAGGMLLPVLPVDRLASRGHAAEEGDPTSCDYWRYCAVDGYLCSCCGGAPGKCPPGSSPSPTSWVGTCQYPGDGAMYLIAYRDCCGKDSCGRCACLRTEGELPVYRPQLNNDMVWCFGAPTMMYHCSNATIIGRA